MPSSLPVRVSSRVALLSILGFWLFYFAVATCRSLAMAFENKLEMSGWRILVGLAGIAITIALWLVLRQASRWTLRHAILLAAIASAPAAIAFASANWFVFYQLRGHPSHTVAIRRTVEPRTISIDDKTMTISVGNDSSLGRDEEMSPRALIADTAMSAYFFFVAWSAFYFALAYAAAVRVAERRAASFEAAARSAELRALRYQVSPHFLFNTLNSLSSLVLQGRAEAAEEMIQSLAAFFRTSLMVDATADVTLSEEVALQRMYLAIEAVRFRDRLKVEFIVPEALESACVPGLILQPLVENAIKYGVSRTARPVTVSIVASEDARGLVLTVRDDGEEPQVVDPYAASGTGVGLANVRERLAARHGSAASCVDGPLSTGGYSVVLTMPLVRHGC